MKKTLVIALVALVILAFGTRKSEVMSEDNTLTSKEKKEGWKLLFDGKTLNGWHKYGEESIGAAWQVNDNAIHLNVSDKADWQAKNGGDILSQDAFENFHLQLDWKVAQNGNSGIIFYVHEDPSQYKFPWMTGPEMQVLDNDGHPDSKIIKHRAADLYDLITAKETVKKAGEWNHAEIISNKGKLQFFLNGEKVLETTMWDDHWKEMIAKSKFHEFPGFGTYNKGKLCLQDHGDKVWFKNIKIKSL